MEKPQLKPSPYTSLVNVLSFILVYLSLAGTNVQAEANWEYSVRPGDTLWSVCKTYSKKANCWQALGPFNGIEKPRALSIGERLKMPVTWLKQEPIAAEIIYLHGEVFWQSNKDAQPQALNANKKLKLSQRIMTKNGSATLRFKDGSLLTLFANTEIHLDSVSAFSQTRPITIQLNMPRGQVEVEVPKRTPRTEFEVKTPSAVAAVRGTRFAVTASPAEQHALTRSEVFEGQVDFGAQQKVTALSQGLGSLAKEGQAPIDPVTLLAAPEWNLSCAEPGRVEWFELPTAVEYRLALMENDFTSDKIIQTISATGNGFTFYGIEEKCYKLKLNAKDGLGFTGMPTEREFCYQEKLATPTIYSTIWKQQQLNSEWSSVTGATHYTLEFSQQADFSTVAEVKKVAAVELDKTGFTDVVSNQNFNTGYLRVRAENDKTVSDYSDVIEVEHSQNNHWLLGIFALIVAAVFI